MAEPKLRAACSWARSAKRPRVTAYATMSAYRGAMQPVDFEAFGALTFDCYGTLIDWEAGLLAAAGPIVAAHGVRIGDGELLEAYARHSSALEAGPYLTYREVLGRSLVGLGAELGFEPTAQEITAFSGSVGDWPAFEDSPGALADLKRRFRLGVITNCDDDLFALSERRLGIDFDWVVTARQAGAYKPDSRGFALAFERIDVARERILHVAQSLYHDHVTAKALGMTTVWVDRRGDKGGFGATPAAEATPDLTVPDMRTLAELAGASA